MDALLPDAEKLLGGFLREHADLVPLHGGRVSTSLGKDFPAIRLTRISGLPLHPWEDSPVVQVECWAETRGAANDLARHTLAALGDIIGAYPQGRVGGHEIAGAIIPFQDDQTLRHKFQFDVRLLTYPADPVDSRD